MKLKITFVVLVAFVFSASAQFNPEAPWMESLNIKSKASNKPLKFQEIVDAFNIYWESRDPNIKGSGYKPFKRWENYWQYFVKLDGTLPTNKELYNRSLELESYKTTNQNQFVDNSNWVPIGPFSHTPTGSWSPGQGRVNVVVKDPLNPNTYYAGAPAGGFWKSIDAGASWVTTTDNLEQIGVSGIAVTGSTIYIATGDDDGGDTRSIGVMKSVDGGLTFLPTGLNPNNFPNVDSMNDIYINPNNTDMLWVATNEGILKTTDAGLTWNIAIGTSGVNMRDIKIKPNDPSVIYAVSSNRFYKSTNSGDNFNILISGLPFGGVSRYVLDVTPANPNVVYLLSATNASSFGAIYKSSNSGNTFSTVADEANNGDIFQSTQSWYDLAFAVSDTNENQVFVGVLNIWRGTIGASPNSSNFTQINNWSSPNGAAYTHADIHYLRFFNGELLAGTDGGFYKSINNGNAFTDLTAGMQISQFYRISVAKHTSDKIVGGLQDNGGHAYNNNEWKNYYGADGMDAAIDPNNSNLYYGFIQNGGSLQISSSSGNSNDGAISGPENGNWITPLAINKDSEIFAGYSRLYKLVNNEFVAVSAVQSSNIDQLEIDEINPDNMYIAVNNVLRKSTNRGVNFTNSEVFNSNITSIEVNNSDNNIVYVTTSFDVFKSNDGGINFVNISNGLPNLSKNVIKHQALHSKNPLFVGTSSGVYRYDDDTLLWEPFDTGLPNVFVSDLEINILDDKITAGTYGRGIWQSDIPLELATNDLKLVTVTNVSTEISCNDNIAPIVEVKNNGQNLINSIDVSYFIDGVQSDFNWTGNLAAGTNTTISLPNINLGIGIHTLKVSTTILNDAYAVNNDSQNIVIYANNSGANNTVNTLENNTDDLLNFNENSSSQLWSRGVPTGTFLNDASNPLNKVYGTNLSGQYPNSVKSYLVSKCYDLTTLDNPELKFDMAFDLEENWDILYLEYSTDGGLTWSLLGTANDPNWYNNNTQQGQNNTCFNCPGEQWTGIDANLTEYKKDLTVYTNESNFMFRYVFHSDVTVTNEGAIIDNIVITGNILGTDEFSKSNISIYPNPSQGIFSLKTIKNMTFNYIIYDVTGKSISQDVNVSTSNNTYQFNVKNYSKGMYFLKITSDNLNFTKKMMLN